MHIVNVKHHRLYFVSDAMQFCPWKSIVYVLFPPSLLYSDLIQNLNNFSKFTSLCRKKDTCGVATEHILEAKSGNFWKDETNIFIIYLDTIFSSILL